MQEVTGILLYTAIEVFKDKYGIKTPLDDRIEEIITKLKEKKESK